MKKLKILYVILDAIIMIGSIAWAVTKILNDDDVMGGLIIIGAGIVISMVLSICLVIIPTLKKNQ